MDEEIANPEHPAAPDGLRCAPAAGEPSVVWENRDGFFAESRLHSENERKLLWRIHKMPAVMTKEDARKLIEGLPERSTWDDLMHEIFVRQAIETGLADSRAGRTRDVAEVRQKFGLPA